MAWLSIRCILARHFKIGHSLVAVVGAFKRDVLGILAIGSDRWREVRHCGGGRWLSNCVGQRGGRWLSNCVGQRGGRIPVRLRSGSGRPRRVIARLRSLTVEVVLLLEGRIGVRQGVRMTMQLLLMRLRLWRPGGTIRRTQGCSATSRRVGQGLRIVVPGALMVVVALSGFVESTALGHVRGVRSHQRLRILHDARALWAGVWVAG